MSSANPIIVVENDALSPSGRATITAERFISPEYMEREREKIWGKSWLVAGIAQDVAEPGDYFVFNLGRESIIVARTNEGKISAQFNACRHRGARIAINNMGAVDAFVCPYHGWTYDLDGTLKHAPDPERFANGLPTDQLSLKSVRVETWAGMVWVCMDPDAPSLMDFLGPIPDLVDPYRVEEKVLAVDQTVSLHANWKTVIDNFGELYHVEHIHPQHETIFDCPSNTTELWAGGHNRVLIDGFTVNTKLPIPNEVPMTQHPQMQMLGLDPDDYKGRVLDVRRDIQAKKREMGPQLGYNYDRLSDEQLSDIVQYNVFPNIILAIQPEETWIMRARPHPTDPNWCFWDKFTLRMLPYPDAKGFANLSFNVSDDHMRVEVLERPEHEDFTQEDVIAGKKTMTITVDQDVHLLRDVQRGMHSWGFESGWLNEDESRVQHFHDWVDWYIGD